jgi:hypothetical protein
LTCGQRTLFSFQPVTVQELIARWLDHHENILRSSIATQDRYRTAAGHLLRFVERSHIMRLTHEVDAEGFAAYLREVKIAPNGHANASAAGVYLSKTAAIEEAYAKGNAYWMNTSRRPPLPSHPLYLPKTHPTREARAASLALSSATMPSKVGAVWLWPQEHS